MNVSYCQRLMPGRWSALALLEVVRQRPYAFLLDSSLAGGEDGRYTLAGCDPFCVLREDRGHRWEDVIAFQRRYAAECTGLPGVFPAGAAGYLGYEFGAGWEKVAPRPTDGALPGFVFGFYDTVIVLDHWTGEVTVISTGLPAEKGYDRRCRARQRMEDILAMMARAGGRETHPEGSSGYGGDIRPLMTRAQYKAMITRALEYIRQGDIYQVNLAQAFEYRFNGPGPDPAGLYAGLRAQAPSRFAAYFDAGDHQIVSASPERFIRIAEGRVQTRPMKGTRPRGTDPAADAALRRQLLDSPKDTAELLMITDLERNDLGRVCDFGSVRVRNLRCLEEYSTVFQTTSLIEGRLSRGKDAFDVLAACFPGGSISGCPKIRAMQVIRELEPVARGPYTGALGYIAFNGRMDMNILIRTLVCRRGKVCFHAGGGIVADSEPGAEYEETLVKAAAMSRCLSGGDLERSCFAQESHLR